MRHPVLNLDGSTNAEFDFEESRNSLEVGATIKNSWGHKSSNDDRFVEKPPSLLTRGKEKGKTIDAKEDLSTNEYWIKAPMEQHF